MGKDDSKMIDERLMHFRTAKELNEEFKEVLLKKQLHFRGNIGSFSLISLSRNTPEQGKGGFVDRELGRKCMSNIDDILAGKMEKIDQGKSKATPEKELQAWIISYAINNDYTLPFSNGIKFLTSELAYPSSKKIVNDILAIDQEGTLVIVELKSARDKSKLEEQLTAFYSVIANDKAFFEQLIDLISPIKPWNGKIRKMIVWPDANGKPRNDWADEGIEEIRYTEIKRANGPEIDYDFM